MALFRKNIIRILCSLLLFGIAIRLVGIASRPIWYDEAFSLLISEKGPAAVLQATLSPDANSASADIHPPTYYFLLWGWIQLFGSSVISARVLSILISLGINLLVFFVIRDLVDEPTALAATLGVVLMPFQVHYAVEIRMYGLLALSLTLATYTYWKAIQTGKLKWWVVFSFAAALGQYTHNLAVFYLIPLAVVSLFLKNRKVVRNTILAGCGAILLYLPWLIHIPAQFAKVQQYYWVDRPTIASLINLVLTYITNLPLPSKFIGPSLFIALFCIVSAGFQTYQAIRQKTETYKIGLFLFYLAFIPPLFLWLFSQWQPVYLERALLPSHVFFCAWLAWVLLKAPSPRLIRVFTFGLLSIGMMIGLYQHYNYQGFPYAPYHALGQSLAERSEPGEIIIHSNKLTYLPMLYYDRSLPQEFIIDVPGSPIDTLAPATRSVLDLNESTDIRSATNGQNSIWFVIFQKEIDEHKAAGKTTSPNLQYLMDHFRLLSKEEWGELLLYHFMRVN